MSFYREQFGYREGMFPVCEDVAARSIALPFFPGWPRGRSPRSREALGDVLQVAPAWGRPRALAMRGWARGGSRAPGSRRRRTAHAGRMCSAGRCRARAGSAACGGVVLGVLQQALGDPRAAGGAHRGYRERVDVVRVERRPRRDAAPPHSRWLERAPAAPTAGRAGACRRMKRRLRRSPSQDREGRRGRRRSRRRCGCAFIHVHS